MDLFQFTKEFGVIGAAFMYMLWQSHNREKQLMLFISNINDEFAKVSVALSTLAEDLRDVRRNSDSNAKKLEENSRKVDELARRVVS